jgi:hypothetical protein
MWCGDVVALNGSELLGSTIDGARVAFRGSPFVKCRPLVVFSEAIDADELHKFTYHDPTPVLVRSPDGINILKVAFPTPSSLYFRHFFDTCYVS